MSLADIPWQAGSAYFQTNLISSVIAVQGLGAHRYYTWVKKKSSAMQQESSKPLSSLGFIPRRRRIDQTPKPADIANSSDAPIKEASTEVMWLRDLLPQFLPSARIATYSYKSDWRQNVKTNLRQCGEQLLNVLYQSRSSEKVSTLDLARCYLINSSILNITM